MSEKQNRDVEKVYSTSEFVSKLRRLADALETGRRFEIQVAATASSSSNSSILSANTSQASSGL